MVDEKKFRGTWPGFIALLKVASKERKRFRRAKRGSREKGSNLRQNVKQDSSHSSVMIDSETDPTASETNKNKILLPPPPPSEPEKKKSRSRGNTHQDDSPPLPATVEAHQAAVKCSAQVHKTNAKRHHQRLQAEERGGKWENLPRKISTGNKNNAAVTVRKQQQQQRRRRPG